MTRLLVVDDDDGVRTAVRRIAQASFEVSEASDAEVARKLLLCDVPDVLVTDLSMPGGSGADLAAWALARFPELAVVVVTGHATLTNFVELFRIGVADILVKPFARDDFERSLLRCLETRRLRHENATLRDEMTHADLLGEIIGESPAIQSVRQRIRDVATTDATVLVTGSSGTGKELVALAVHAASARRSGPFVVVHCGALHGGLLESELFGHVRGAFTGARGDHAGSFEEASGGTLFLDEVGTMSEGAQVRLLRVVQERRVVRVGDTRERDVDVRLVAATNADLGALVACGRFREDLHYRLDVFGIHLPDLRDRPGDVPLLASRLLAKACRRMGRSQRTLSQEAVRRLLAHDWPGNVRELENVMEAAVIAAGARTVIEADDVLGASTTASTVHLPIEGIDLSAHLASLEAEMIRQALARAGGSPARAARLLHLSRTTLARKARDLEIEARSEPPPSTRPDSLATGDTP